MKYVLTILVLILLAHPLATTAASLSSVRDLLSTSVKNVGATHQIDFTVTNAVPASGKIVITPHPGAFSIPLSFDYTDVDLLVSSSGGPYTDRALSAAASATEDGVAVVSGSAGSITITLQSGSGIVSGERVRILLGTNAVFGEAGDQLIVNPATTGSYRVSLETQNASSVRIDDAGTRIAIVEQVTASTVVQLTPPIRSNGLPSGVLSHGNSAIELSLNTNEIATCRYATTTNVVYAAMTETFTAVGGTLHTKVVTGHVDNTSYSYYVRCADVGGTENTDDYEIAFSLEDTPEILVSTGQTTGSPGPTGGGGGSGGVPGGSTALFLANITLSGVTTPNGAVTVLKDGTESARATAGADGRFQVFVSNLERGTYTFGTFVTDRAARKSSLFSSTITVGQGTNNNLTNIILPPTIGLSETSVAVGSDVTVSGESAPGSTIEVYVREDGDTPPAEPSYTTRATQGTPGSSDGLWSVVIPGRGLSRGTYEVRALAVSTLGTESTKSSAVYVGIGEDPSPDFSTRADINGDGRTNLVDFSILLSFWGTGEERADMNLDGTVNLADFSILLFNWTG